MSERQQRMAIFGAVLFLAALIAFMAWATWALVNNPGQAATVRDIFIIFMALETMVIGVALVVLIVQLAVLTNMLKHEIKPILEATNETVNTVRGTTIFLSENITEPIVRLNAFVAGLDRLLDTMGFVGGFFRKK